MILVFKQMIHTARAYYLSGANNLRVSKKSMLMVLDTHWFRWHQACEAGAERRLEVEN